MSAGTIRKAKKLVESGGVAQIDESTYQVRSSSDPDQSYIVEGGQCTCPGFKNYYKFHHGKGKANCSHLEAVRIYREDSGST